ncbi:rhomboid family intramembrane serine protease [Flavobacterium sp. MC2016-06]|jgi:membrane associated rhomboid family serine protease|uniref:rhomboid family protein n=1 Tax=Flavobacterium sp. MC2016-06 TaxID=2676308 RepID=UPI0012BA75DD|nr:rhomboid family intramembrane serine protease [Flavobacterium sp. MC2016-06]MBU3859564.1 rhomboid family intramembrane serine protease [Flavobacterium sp. MC2016-06]
MINTGVVGFIIIAANVLLSYKGFNDRTFYDKYKFEVDKILINKEYYRLFTSSFLHVDWQHLIFNMLSLYFFFELVELQLGSVNFLILYSASLVGGDLLALFIHRNHGDYSAVGASGAVCGIIFAAIALFPGLGIGIFLLPFSIPSWLYGILYVAFTIYGIKSKRDNIGHEAHLGGALIGMLVAIVLFPACLRENYIPIIIVFVPSVLFIYFIITKPHMLLIDNNFFKSQKKYFSIEDRYNEEKRNRQLELDRLLDKISQKGINSLSKKEKQKLEELSNKR